MRYVVALLVFLTVPVVGQSLPSAATSNDHWDFIAANRMLHWASNNGALARNPLTLGPGLEWPRGSGAMLVMTEGLIVFGMVENQPRVSGATYNHGWQAGHILPDGTADDPAAPMHRVYRIHQPDPVYWQALPATDRQRMLRDLREWPVALGAPWVDADGNGVYEPDTARWLAGEVTDAPRLPGDEALWFVSNDLDFQKNRAVYGTEGSGLEMRTMIWASAGHPLLENVVFREHTLINKGDQPILDMHIGAWEDVDVGDPFDDYCGVDTALGMAYSYNGRRTDEIYGVPPATGTVWLQTPVIPAAGSTARFGLGMRPDHANLPLSAFSYYIGGSSVYREPQPGDLSGAIDVQKNFLGRKADGSGYVDPTTGAGPVAHCHAGDPVAGTGWIDGIVSRPGDRRYLSGSGTFSLAPGDTQKVLFARVAVNGGNHLLAVRSLRAAARQLHDIYRNLPMGVTPPVFTARLVHLAPAGSYEVHATGGPFPDGTSLVQAVLRAPDGAVMQTADMHDDGQHGDGAAGDGVYGVTLAGAGRSTGADLFILSTDHGLAREWFVDSELPLPGRADVAFTEVVLDTPKPDGRAQPGEHVRLRLRITNAAAVEMGPWSLFLRGDASRAADRAVQRFVDTLAPGAILHPVFDADEMGTYIAFDLPAETPPGIYSIPVTLMSAQHCAWEQNLAILVDSLVVPTSHGLLAHVAGNATGTLAYLRTDIAALTDHDYRVSIEGEDFNEKTMHVEDVTLGTTLRRDLALPDRFHPLSPVIDGWQLSIGTAFDHRIYIDGMQREDRFVDDARGVFSAPERTWFTLYEDDLLCADESFLGSARWHYDLKPVRLVFDRAAGQRGVLYHRGMNPNYGYQGTYDMPVRAYDISDTANPRRLMVGFLEQRNAPTCDSIYMPSTVVNHREILLVFEDDYSEQPDPKFEKPLDTRAPAHALLYTVVALRDTAAPMFEDGDTYTITPRIPVSKRDVYILSKPRPVGVESVPSRPAAVALRDCYPNPAGTGVSGGAAVHVDFDTPGEGPVRLTLYNTLGRRVASIVDQRLEAGTHRLTFDTASLRSGIYIVLLETATARETRTLSIIQ